MPERSFLLLHGLGGSGPHHWQTWLYGQLKERGLDVHYPTFSNFDHPNLKEWLQELNAALDKIAVDNPVTVLAHSCGCSLWLHYAAATPKRKVDLAILVAPPSPFLDLPEAATFYPLPMNGQNLAHAANETWYILSTDDPYCSVRMQPII